MIVLRSRLWLLALPLVLGCSKGTVSSPPPVPSAATTPFGPETLPTDADARQEVHLEGAINGRDLGGLPGRRGPVPADHFLRSAELSHATRADRDALVSHGVKLDLDLRTAGEARGAPDTLASDPRFQYENISLFGDSPVALDKVTSLGGLYIETLADKQPELRRIFERIAAQREGATLVHCTAGKDRTGMVVAILLDLAGVDRATILHNYALSLHYFKPVAEEVLVKQPSLARLMGSPPAEMNRFLDALDGAYGGPRAYLLKIGVSEADVAALTTRLGQ